MNKLNKLLWGILSFGIHIIYQMDARATEYTTTSKPWWYELKVGDKIVATDDCTATFELSVKTVYESKDDTQKSTIDKWVENHTSCITLITNSIAGIKNYDLDSDTMPSGLCDTYHLPNCNYSSDPTINICSNASFYYVTKNSGDSNNPLNYTCKKCPTYGTATGKTDVAIYSLFELSYGSYITCHQFYRKTASTDVNSTEYVGLFSFKLTDLENAPNPQVYCSKASDSSYYLISQVNTAGAAKITDCYKPVQTGSDDKGHFAYESPQRCYYE